MTLHVERQGQGPDLVLLHGWGLHGGVWQEVAEALARRFRVHLVDLPGHGHSAGVAFENFETAAEAVARALPPVSLVCGWSLGGLVALQIARRYPERIQALALVASTPCFAQRPGWSHGVAPGSLDAFAADLAADASGTIRRFVALNAIGGTRNRQAIRALGARLAERGAPHPTALSRGLEALRQTDLREAAAHVRARTLVIHGGRDVLAPVAAGRWLAERIPGARFVEYAEAAHMPFFTRREAFVAALAELYG